MHENRLTHRKGIYMPMRALLDEWWHALQAPEAWSNLEVCVDDTKIWMFDRGRPEAVLFSRLPTLPQ